ncbi:MAG: leucine-rich repeat protein [Acidobacteria bacterium]|nr:leucine-rich repeat protein [Acidobacteriota bacterium]
MAQFTQRSPGFLSLVIWIAGLWLASDHSNAQGVCDRTPQVRDALVRSIPEVSTCGDVTPAHLARVTALTLEKRANRPEIAELQEDDFSGLSSLRWLRLHHNALTALPEGIFRDLNALEQLTLHHNALTTLPQAVFRDLSALQGLSLDGNALNTLPEGVFRGLNNLQILGLRFNSLTALPAGVFGGLGNLKELSLVGNNLSAIPPKLFTDLTSLEDLYLPSNPLNTLPQGVFSSLQSLRALSLLDCSLSELPEKIFNRSSTLATLQLGSNSLSELPVRIFDGLSSLELLSLTNNEFVSLPKGIFDDVLDTLTFLQVDPGLMATMAFSSTEQSVSEGDTIRLTVTLNRASPVTVHVPYSVGGTLTKDALADPSASPESGIPFLAGETSKELVFTLADDANSRTDRLELTLDGSIHPIRLRKSDDTGDDSPIPWHSLFELPPQTATHTLTVFDADTSPELGGICGRTRQVVDYLLGATGVARCADVTPLDLSLVQHLSIDAAGITELRSNDFDGLYKLYSLSLTHNSLSSLPEDIFRELFSLADLDLRSNSLTSLPKGIFRGLRVIRLNLGHNSLSTLPEGIFNGLMLWRLSLGHNPLHSLPQGIIRGQKSLKRLNLYNISVSNLDEHIFRGLDELEFLFLYDNSLASLPEGIFRGLNKLSYLDLSNTSQRELPEGLFRGLGALSELHLSNNSLSELPAEVFNGLEELGSLDLSNNTLSELSSEIFHGLESLYELNLSGNDMASLPAGIFDDVLDTLEELEVDSNLRAALALASIEQTAAQGTTVRVAVTLSRALPVAVRATYALSGTATPQDYSGLSPSPDRGLLFAAGETRKEVTFTLSRNAGRQGRTIILSLGEQNLAFRRADGTGPDVPYDYRIALLDLSPHTYVHTVTIVDFDPSTFTQSELAGKQLALNRTGPEAVTVVFDHGNRFQAVTRSEKEPPSIRSGSYAYHRTAPYRGRLILTYDDGETCTVDLTFASIEAGTSNSDCFAGSGSFRLTREGFLSFVPVILSAAGRNESFFTSELTLVNRGSERVELNYTYRAKAGGGGGNASDTLAPGRQRIEPDAFEYLRSLGIPIPDSGNRLGTLVVDYPTGTKVNVMVRTTTDVPEGRAGLAYTGIAGDAGFNEPVYLCGLRQNAQDRSNVAFQNMGSVQEGPITLRTTVFSGDPNGSAPRVLEDVTLQPGGFHQYSGVLGTVTNGYVKVERVSGAALFYAYGVINDQANSDGSFVFPVTASSLEGRKEQILPVIVETGNFASELTVTNISDLGQQVIFVFYADAVQTSGRWTSFDVVLESGEQKIIPNIINALRQKEYIVGIGPAGPPITGAVFVDSISEVVIGARTGSPSVGGGQYGVFYHAIPDDEVLNESAWVFGLQQNESNRSNLALINAGEFDNTSSVFSIDIFNGETGQLVRTIATRPIAPHRRLQLNGILGTYAPGITQGYVRIRRISGRHPFLAYGVVNDGAAPGERSGDGAYIPAQK